MAKQKPRQKRKSDSIRAIELRAYELVESGLAVGDTARMLHRKNRSIITYCNRVRRILSNDTDFAEARLKFATKAPILAVDVFLKYLEGEGDAVGGDLKAAIRVLETWHLIERRQGGDRAGSANNFFISRTNNQTTNTNNTTQVTAQNCDIVIRSDADDEDFARGCPEELGRLLEAIKKSQSGLLAGQTSDQETAG